MEFHISRQARERYQFDQSLFSFNGNVIFANFHAARQFAQKMNAFRDLVHYPEKAVKAGQINALGLIDEILHLVVHLYRTQKNPRVMEHALAALEESLGKPKVDELLLAFTLEFPPLPVYRGEMTANQYLQQSTDGLSNRAGTLEEILLLWVNNKNPAVTPYLELFDDENLSQQTAYQQALQHLYHFVENQPPFGPDLQNLIDLLRQPAIAHPYSLFEQLEYIRTRWAELIGKYLYRLLSSLDFIKEEEKLPFLGPGPVEIPAFDKLSSAGEPENFSPDREWMPRLVLMAKNTYVWLDQLSKKYQKPISRLDQIPEEELAQLAEWGFSGLWLIGLWERSKASARIKQLCGNPEAIASAYSLAGYTIAADLGGEEAYQVLRDRAWKYGIRLASDMVPNHMGIDSPWVIEHPDWFISLDYSPFPSYSFSGPDLSGDPRVEILLEDHYYTRTDAAVVFKRTDRSSGKVQYIYHGNDGTSMPWNDTAQLNYLNPQVREAVIQTILEVARRFPIIRFDAAMTLTKRHYQRLWFPEPGTGGAIPSRAEHGMTKEAFDRAFPNEFWREVVDRVAQEAPDTLLLAEAFWLMEGYFVRTLGMHRVYNSAFMNMLRNEDNAGYRKLIKNTIEFEPEILKRYVNFMNNPDERTAVDQFGKGDKYFGICTLMSTLPGLPMFGHGQIEGYAEKYGMEFRRAYWDEKPDPYLIERHKRQIFPLLHRRALFAGVENFLLYDFFTSAGWVNEDVFAYSNRLGNDRALVVYHNKFAETEGWIRWSAGFKSRENGTTRLVQRSLSEGLGLSDQENHYVIFRDLLSGMEYIRSASELAQKGLHLKLSAYQAYVFSDFREVPDDEYGSYRTLTQYLSGRGVPNIQEALHELLLAPIIRPWREIVNAGYINFLLAHRLTDENPVLPPHLLDEASNKLSALVDGIGAMTGSRENRDLILHTLQKQLEFILCLQKPQKILPLPTRGKSSKAFEYLKQGILEDKNSTYILLIYPFINKLGALKDSRDPQSQTLSWIEEWRLMDAVMDTAYQIGIDGAVSWRIPPTLRMLINHQNWFEKWGSLSTSRIMENWLSDLEVQRFIGVNRYKEVLWYNHEAFLEFIWWMNWVAVLEAVSKPAATHADILETLLATFEITQSILTAEIKAGYRVADLMDQLSTTDLKSK
ncbi:MAG: alpha-amylase family glycosyl hydrolase [Chloroflexota bacterium]